MNRALVAGLACAILCGAPAAALETTSDADGTLNSAELTIDYWVARLDEKPFDKKICTFGYPAAKMGNHPAARRIFEACSEAGVAGAMPWMAWTEENGYDKPSNPEAAAKWDKTLADTGSSLGAFNYGLDLLRGRGVAQDPVAGRNYIDRAARDGDATARELAASGYDPEAVTPDADKDRYRKFGY
jgi:hypothetical protein